MAASIALRRLRPAAGGRSLAGGPAAAASDGSRRERPPRTLADVGLGETATDQARDAGRRDVAEPGRQVRAAAARRRPRPRRLVEGGLLLRPEPRSARRFAGGRRRAAARPVSVSRDPSFVARPCTRAEERPLEGRPVPPSASARNRRSEPARPSGPARSRTGRGPVLELAEQVGVDCVEHRLAVRRSRRPRRRARQRARAVRAGPAEASPGGRAPAARDSGRRSRAASARPSGGRSGPSARTRSTIGLARSPRARGASARTTRAPAGGRTRRAPPRRRSRSASAGGTRYV